MAFADCRKVVKQGDTLKIRWLDASGQTITCDIYDPAMNKTTETMTENPSGSGIYELVYIFSAGDGDYLFVVNGEGLQVSSIPELSKVDKIQLDASNFVKSVAQNPELANLDAPVSSVKQDTEDIRLKTDQLQFDNGRVEAVIDDSQLAKEHTLKVQQVEIERLRNRMRVR